ncbi:MAG: hypothetical protein P4M11_11595 [Candidatus Pacebacteria bacterium]|nr:hypothetical protein [Candidatus Paceibacterota bacterium]
MKNTTLIIIGIVVVVLAGLGIYFYLNSASTTSPTGAATSTNPFGPVSNSNPSESTSTSAGSSGSTIPVTLKSGTKVVVPNFTKQNQPSTANATSGYQVAGTNTSDFQILYYPDQSYFIVSLFTEPLGATRLAAESALRTTLGLSNSQLCQLNIQVETTSDVSDVYSGHDLGLSFCSGAVQLP